MAHLNEMVKKLDAGTLSVGFDKGANYDNGMPVAQVAFWHEFGTGTAPPRPFFRPMIAKESPMWGRNLAALLRKKDMDATTALEGLGNAIALQLEESIINEPVAALSPVTLMLRKMFPMNHTDITGKDVAEARHRVAAGEEGASGTQAKPLDWTGHMKKSITSRVD
jgi:hypothetical protein